MLLGSQLCQDDETRYTPVSAAALPPSDSLPNLRLARSPYKKKRSMTLEDGQDSMEGMLCLHHVKTRQSDMVHVIFFSPFRKIFAIHPNTNHRKSKLWGKMSQEI